MRKISKLFQGSVKDGSMKMEGCSKRPSRELHIHRYLKEVQREFQGIFKDVFSNFQGCLKKVLGVLREIFKKKFQECLKNVSMKIEGCS